MGRMLFLGTSRANHPFLFLKQFQLILAKLPLFKGSTKGGDVDHTNLKKIMKRNQINLLVTQLVMVYWTDELLNLVAKKEKI